jgi:WD40 repeat protein
MPNTLGSRRAWAVLIPATAIAVGVIVGVFVLPVPSAPARAPAPRATRLAVVPASAAGGKVTVAALGPGGILGLGTNQGRVFVQTSPGHGRLQPAAGEFAGRGSIDLITFSGDGTTLAGLTKRGTVWAWRRGGAPIDVPVPLALRSGFPLYLYPAQAGPYGPSQGTAISLSRDGRLLAISDSADLYVYDLAQGRARPVPPLIARYRLHNSVLNGGPSNPVFSTQGRSAALSGSCRIGPRPTSQDGLMYVTCPNGHALLSGDGSTAAVGFAGFVEVWNLRNGRSMGDLLAPSMIQSYALSGDGATLAISTDTGLVLVFDLRADRAPTRIQAIPAQRNPFSTGLAIESITLSSDGSLLLVTPYKGRSTVWSIR